MAYKGRKNIKAKTFRTKCTKKPLKRCSILKEPTNSKPNAPETNHRTTKEVRLNSLQAEKDH